MQRYIISMTPPNISPTFHHTVFVWGCRHKDKQKDWSSLAAQEFFDNSRAIDYLLSRKDIDGDRRGEEML